MVAIILPANLQFNLKKTKSFVQENQFVLQKKKIILICINPFLLTSVFQHYKYNSIIAKIPNKTLPIPLVVKNAKLTLDRSFGLTKLCW